MFRFKLLLAIVCLCFFADFLTLDTKVDYCYVQNKSFAAQPYELRGHIKWRFDRSISFHNTLEDALRDAALLKCPLESEKNKNE